MALSPKEKKELQQRFEKQLLPDLDMSFELNDWNSNDYDWLPYEDEY